MNGTSRPSASTTTRSSRLPRRSAPSSGRISQTPAERRLSKLAAAINQKWRQTGNEGVKITADDLASTWLKDSGKCRYCSVGLGLMDTSFDHVVPFHKGGSNSPGNLATCCTTCQRAKYTKTPEEHAAYQALWRTCPIDRKRFKPRWADYVRGYGFYCSRKCAGKSAH